VPRQGRRRGRVRLHETVERRRREAIAFATGQIARRHERRCFGCGNAHDQEHHGNHAQPAHWRFRLRGGANAHHSPPRAWPSADRGCEAGRRPRAGLARHRNAVLQTQSTADTPFRARSTQLVLPPRPSLIIDFALTPQGPHPQNLITAINAFARWRSAGNPLRRMPHRGLAYLSEKAFEDRNDATGTARRHKLRNKTSALSPTPSPQATKFSITTDASFDPKTGNSFQSPWMFCAKSSPHASSPCSSSTAVPPMSQIGRSSIPPSNLPPKEHSKPSSEQKKKKTEASLPAFRKCSY